ncbi:hypothetical protein [Humibacillus xanthopallidus]|uniref:hypothetical protein n=1 Tax=Humibacillus xanthopallidus TaxID=412689 RepID=UPI0011503717|nr:hypothetical protein [Humibacillus xanthopallidus]
MEDSSCSLNVYRTWGTANIYAIPILLDEVEVGRLRPGQSLHVQMAAGPHTVQPRFPGLSGKALSARAAVEFRASPGQQVDLRLAVGKFGLTEFKLSGPSQKPPPRTSATALHQGREVEEIGANGWSPTPSTVICQISEGKRYEVEVGDPEIRVIDNSSGLSDAVRTFKLSRTWSRTLTTDTERALRATGGLSIPWVQVKAEIDGALTQHLSRSFQEQQSFEDTVVITSAARTKTTVFFAWREIRQQGNVRVLVDGVEADVPFEAVIGLSFDQRQVDERVD